MKIRAAEIIINAVDCPLHFDPGCIPAMASLVSFEVVTQLCCTTRPYTVKI